MITRRRSASPRAYLWGISAVVGAALILSSCGGQGANTDGGSGKDAKAAKSPLEPYLGPGGSGMGEGMSRTISIAKDGQSDKEKEEQQAKQRRVEEAVVACMKDAGFDYVANNPKDDPIGKAYEQAYGLPPEEFAKKYGYGITTMDHLMPTDEKSTDPNQKIREKLTKSAQGAYDKALYGGDVVVMDGGGGVITKAEKPRPKSGTPKPQDRGCYDKASETVYGKPKEGAEDSFKKFESMWKDLESLRKRMDNDQRLKDAQKAWSDCMADAGHPGYKKPEEAQQKLWDKFSEASQEASPEEGSEGSEGDEVSRPKSMKMMPLDPAKRKEIRDLELKIAPADLECKKKEYDEPAKKVQFELEKEFLEQHKSQLEEYRKAMGENGMNSFGGVG